MSKKSILYWFFVFFLIGFILSIPNVKANPPGLSLDYDIGTDQLDVTITHNNGGNINHYISSMTIRVNGSIVKTQLYTSQPGNVFIYSYDNITANEGATIQVTAFCTFTGDQSTSIVVGSSGNGTPTNGEPTIPGYLGIYLVVVISILAFLAINYKKIRRLILE